VTIDDSASQVNSSPIRNPQTPRTQGVQPEPLSTAPGQYIWDPLHPESLISAAFCRLSLSLAHNVHQLAKDRSASLARRLALILPRGARKNSVRVFRLYACKGQNPLQAQHLIGMQPYSHCLSMPVWETRKPGGRSKGNPRVTDRAPIKFKAKFEHSRTYRTNSTLTGKAVTGKPMGRNVDKNGRPWRSRRRDSATA